MKINKMIKAMLKEMIIEKEIIVTGGGWFEGPKIEKIYYTLKNYTFYIKDKKNSRIEIADLSYYKKSDVPNLEEDIYKIVFELYEDENDEIVGKYELKYNGYLTKHLLYNRKKTIKKIIKLSELL